MTAAAWDLTALLNAADPKASRALRHLWLVRLVEWLRHGDPEAGSGDTPMPVLRLRHLLNMLERNAEPRARIVALLGRVWTDCDVAALFADFGFTARRDLWGELGERLRLRLLPGTPDTDDLAELFRLLFTEDGDAAWLAAIDAATLDRLAALCAAARSSPPEAAAAADWRTPLLQAMTWLVSSIRAAAFAPALRRRMSPELLVDKPFVQLVRAGEALAASLDQHDDAATLQQASYLRALLERCRRAADSVTSHLEDYGVSVHIVFELEQLKQRSRRLEALLDIVLSEQPQRELQHLVVALVQLSRRRRRLGALVASQYSLLARKVAERHAETGEHYITRNRNEYLAMLRQAAGGGAVLAVTTFAKFAILALGMAPFWAGLGAGLNYAASFLVVQWLHWTVATKQPAMTAPAMADKLVAVHDDRSGSDAAIEAFVDEITHLVRSQIAGIAGNLAAVVPFVVSVQLLCWWLAGRPLVSEVNAVHVLESLTLLGPTALFAAFTGVLLFVSSQIAGWAENWFVFHRLESALAHHPTIVARLGQARALRWSRWWHANISALASNVSLGLMLGMVPVVLAFFAFPIDVRHVTLSTGQLAAAVSTLGWQTLREAAFWWCVAGLLVTALLNLGVSFWCALHVAMRSRDITLTERRRLRAALRRRLLSAPRSFVLPR